VDWGLRCDGDRQFLARFPDVERRFANEIEQRLRALQPFRHPIPTEWRFDLAFCRALREVGYVGLLNRLVSRNDFQDTDCIGGELLCFDERLVGDSRQDLGWYGEESMINSQLTLPALQRRFERHARHVHGVVVPFHCKEVDLLTAAAVSTKYCGLPGWWRSREGSYSDLTETPPVLTYLGSYCRNPYSRLWFVAQSELAALRAAEVMVSARAGRLLWASAEAIADIRDVGLENIFYFNVSRVVDDAKALLEWIEKVDWDRTSPELRHLPGYCNEYTSVFKFGGDWIVWDPKTWAPADPEVATVSEQYQRVTVVSGSTENMPQLGLPQGRGGARNNPSVDFRGVRPDGVKRPQLVVAERVVRAFLEEDTVLAEALRPHNGGRRIANIAELLMAVRRIIVPAPDAMAVDSAANSSAEDGTGSQPVVQEPTDPAN